MVLQLMKPAMSAETTIDIAPTSTKLFYVTTAQVDAGTLSIPETQFFQSNGTPAAVFPDHTTWNLSINGVPQMQGISTIAAYSTIPGIINRSLDIELPAGAGPILKGTPIVLEFETFTSSSTTTVTT
ncbi:hypothetical protein BN2127_JRS10_01237 [Bacillus subtilis]|nr:hypothetical protein BN2127_JRS10_01237 [Bacillus subtilis]